MIVAFCFGLINQTRLEERGRGIMGYVNTTAYTTKASRTLSSKSEKERENEYK